MRRVWQVTAVVLAVVAAGVAAFLFMPPAGFVNSKSAQLAKSALGGDIEINGTPSFRFSPFALRLEDVSLSNPSGAPAGTMVHAGTVEIEPTVTFSSWMVPNLELAAVRIDAAQVRLGGAAGGASPAAASAAVAPSNAVEDPLPRLREVKLTRSTVTIQDAGADPVKLEAVDITMTRASAEAPIDVEIKTAFGKEAVAGTVRLEPLKTILAGGPVKTIARLSSSPGRGEFEGTIDRGPQIKVAGKAKLDFPSLEILSNTIGLNPGLLGDGTGSLSGDISIGPAGGAGKTEAPSAAVWEIGVKNGQIALLGKPGQTSQKFENVNAAAKLGGATAPIDVAADLTWAGERIEASTTIQSWAALSKREKSGISGRMSYSKGQIEVTGDVIPGQDTTFLGRAKGTTKDLRGLTNLAGFSLPVDKGVEQVEVDGEVSINANALQLWNAKLIVDGSTARGSLSVGRNTTKTESVSAATRPLVSGKLSIDKLDAKKYVPRFETGPPPSDRADPKARPTGSQDDDDKDRSDPYAVRRNPFSDVETIPLTETLRADIDRLGGRGTAAQQEAPAAEQPGWSTASLGLAGLRKVDLDLDLAINEMQVGQRTVAVPSLKALLNDGRLTLEGKDIASHGGKIAGTAQIDVRERVPTVRTTITAEGVNVDQVFDDLGYVTVLSGKAKMEAELTARGDSEKDLISSLGGKIRTSTGNADIVGWDLRRDWRSFISQRAAGPYNPRARTPVERLTADVRVSDGVAETQEVEVKGRDFGHVGRGSVRLVERTADYRGNLAAFVPPALDVPFFVSGPWSKLKSGLDQSASGYARLILSYFGIRFGNTLESVADADPELDALAREYLEKAGTMTNLTAEDAAALKALQDRLGIKTRQ